MQLVRIAVALTDRGLLKADPVHRQQADLRRHRLLIRRACPSDGGQSTSGLPISQ